MNSISLITVKSRNNKLCTNEFLPDIIDSEEDRFLNMTSGCILIMSEDIFTRLRKDYLRERINIVITDKDKQDDFNFVGGRLVLTPTIDDALLYADKYSNEVFVFGGFQTTKNIINYINRVYVIESDDYSNGIDFPEIDRTNYYEEEFNKYARDESQLKIIKYSKK